MRKLVSLCLGLSISIGCGGQEQGAAELDSTAAAATTYSGYVMGYFKDGTDQYGLNLCYSTDGLHWTDLNSGYPVVYPELGTAGLRDPFVYRKQDGAFAIVATDMKGQTWSDHSQYIHYWGSTDLLTFNSERLLQMHSTDMHTWAPEIFYNYNTAKYAIYWSGNTDYNRTYVNYTTDFSTLTSAEVFFDPSYDVIDSTVTQYNGTAYLFFKDERSTGKSIKAASSTTAAAGSFSVFTPNFITSSYTEGPIVFKDNSATTWYMYADLFAQSGVFECWKTSDLAATSWTKVTDISLPSGTRHGSIVAVTQTELDNLKAAFVPKKLRNATTSLYLDGLGYTTNGANCGQYSSGSSNNQKWVVEQVGSYYKLRNASTGLYLDGMGRTTSGSICGQYAGSTSTNQQWAKAASGTSFKFKNRATGLYLDGAGCTYNGCNVYQYTSSSSSNQDWYIE